MDAVQVAALNKPGWKTFQPGSVGQVYSQIRRRVYKVRIGVFNSRADASSAPHRQIVRI